MEFHRLTRYFVVRESTEGGIIHGQGLADYWMQAGCQPPPAKDWTFPAAALVEIDWSLLFHLCIFRLRMSLNRTNDGHSAPETGTL